MSKKTNWPIASGTMLKVAGSAIKVDTNFAGSELVFFRVQNPTHTYYTETMNITVENRCGSEVLTPASSGIDNLYFNMINGSADPLIVKDL